jgi:hypothetical protein
MELLLMIVGVVVGAGDPILWIAPVIAAFFSRGRGGILPLTGMIWGAVLEVALTQMIPGYEGGRMISRIASGLLVGLVVLGVATLIWKMRGAPAATAAEQDPAAHE